MVEDEPAIADVIKRHLVASGYGVQIEGHGDRALSVVAQSRPAAIILDVGLPGIDGVEVCRRMRAANDWTPVLFVTARDDEVDRILALELGADDYITKPFSPRELVARVSGVLRRTGDVSAQETVTIGTVTLDITRRRAFRSDEEIALTATEFELLAFLMRRPGRVLTRDVLLSEVWGYSSIAGQRTVDVHVAQLRAKLGDASPIRTVRGVGYSAESP